MNAHRINFVSHDELLTCPNHLELQTESHRETWNSSHVDNKLSKCLSWAAKMGPVQIEICNMFCDIISTLTANWPNMA
jgi:hypothetical protein